MNIVGYTYRADTYCPPCTLALVKEDGSDADRHGLPLDPDRAIDVLGERRFGEKYEDARNWDTDDFPKVVFGDQVEDGERCGKCGGEL